MPRFSGNYYGTHASELERAAVEGVDLVLDIDVQGARQLKRKFRKRYRFLFLRPAGRFWKNGCGPDRRTRMT